MAFAAFDVAADVVLVRAVRRAHNLFLGNLEIYKVSHRGPPGRGGWCRGLRRTHPSLNH